MKVILHSALSRTLLFAAIMTTALTPGARAEGWFDSFAQWSFNQLQPLLQSPQAPAVYPHPETGQPTPWQPQNDRLFYGSSLGARG